MKRTYLIDSENINDVWVEILHCLGDKDEILVFYTDKSAHMGYERIIRLMEQKRGVIRWIRCFEGQNALDFQLVTELGSRIGQEPKREYIIVSNDTGYDAVVRYWQQKEYRVRRMKGVECENLPEADEEKTIVEATVEVTVEAADSQSKENQQPKICPVEDAGEKITVPVEDKSGGRKKERKKLSELRAERMHRQAEEANEVETAADDVTEKTLEPENLGFVSANSWNEALETIFRENGSQDSAADMQYLLELCKTIKLSDMSTVHNVLEYHFGQERGNAIYRFIKENPGCRGELSAGYSNNKKQRERQYLNLILKRSHIIAEDGELDAILKILGGIPRKNLNGIHVALVKRFGQEHGGTCYAVLRNHVKIIREL